MGLSSRSFNASTVAFASGETGSQRPNWVRALQKPQRRFLMAYRLPSLAYTDWERSRSRLWTESRPRSPGSFRLRSALWRSSRLSGHLKSISSFG